MKTQRQEEWEAIMARRIADEESGVRRPHVPLRVYFTRAIYLAYALFIVFCLTLTGGFLALLYRL